MYMILTCWFLLTVTSGTLVCLSADVQTLEIDEHAAPSSVLGYVAGSPSPFTDFRIVDDSSGGRFAVDAETGRLTVATVLRLSDFASAADSVHTVHIRIEATASETEDADLQAEFLSSLLEAGLPADDAMALLKPTHSFDLQVTILDAPDAPQLDEQNFSISEYRDADPVVGIVRASDPDAGDSLRFSLIDSSPFRIESETGRLLITDPDQLDHQKCGRHELRVRVTDLSGLYADASVFIDVIPVMNPPVPVAPATMAAAAVQEAAVPARSELEMAEYVRQSIFTAERPETERSAELALTAGLSDPSQHWAVGGILFGGGMLIGCLTSLIWARKRRQRSSTEVSEREAVPSAAAATLSQATPQAEVPVTETGRDIVQKAESLEHLAQDQATLIELLQKELQECREELERVAGMAGSNSQSACMIQLLRSEVDQRNQLISSLRTQLETLTTDGPAADPELLDARHRLEQAKTDLEHMLPGLSPYSPSGEVAGAEVAGSVVTSVAETSESDMAFTPRSDQYSLPSFANEHSAASEEPDLRAELAALFNLTSGSEPGNDQEAHRPEAHRSEFSAHVTAAEQDCTVADEQDHDDYIRKYMSNLLNKKDYQPYSTSPGSSGSSAAATSTVPENDTAVIPERRVADRRRANREEDEDRTEVVLTRQKIDVEQLRNKTNSFRQIALQSVEQALASHTKRKARIGMIVRVILLLSLSLSTLVVVASNLMETIRLQSVSWLMALLMVLSAGELCLRNRSLRRKAKSARRPASANSP